MVVSRDGKFSKQMPCDIDMAFETVGEPTFEVTSKL